eukprot:2928338-Rhodomonas_salina.3
MVFIVRTLLNKLFRFDDPSFSARSCLVPRTFGTRCDTGLAQVVDDTKGRGESGACSPVRDPRACGPSAAFGDPAPGGLRGCRGAGGRH